MPREGMTVIKVLIADDSTIVRAGVRLLLERHPEIEVVGETETPRQTIEGALRLRPDIVLLGIDTPRGAAVPALEELVTRWPKCRVVVVTVHDDAEYLRASLAAGASGYVTKQTAHTQLLPAIHAVNGGKSHVHVTLGECGLRSLVLGGGASAREQIVKARAPEVELTKRERDVLRFIAMGYTNQEIAKLLNLSTKSIEAYKARLSDKTGMQRRGHLIRYAVERDLVDDESSWDP